LECDLTNNKATDSATLPAESKQILDAQIITNTNVQNQPVILSFFQMDDPTLAYASLFDLGAQGQQGTFTNNVGFDINNNKAYAVSLEAAGGTLINLTDMAIEGQVLHTNGVTHLQLNDAAGGSDQAALTAVIHPNTSIDQGETASVDGTEIAQTLTDSTPTVVNYLYGADGNDTLNGSTGTDILNGGVGDLPDKGVQTSADVL